MNEEQPRPVTMAELAKLSAQSRAPVQTFADRLADAQKTRPKTPAGLPRGFAWKPHDTGTRGQAAARRRAQHERQEGRTFVDDITPVCQRCGRSEGKVHCFLDAAKTVAHSSLRECVQVLRARVEELERLRDEIPDELAEVQHD
jgi:hypothetical protein